MQEKNECVKKRIKLRFLPINDPVNRVTTLYISQSIVNAN